MRKHTGFTLIELVVVVMILGILAAVAAPRLLGTSSAASENGLKQTLAVVRDAIERYAAENSGALPAAGSTDQNELKTDLEPYLRGTFPTSPVGTGDALVTVVATGGPMSADPTPATSWKYNSVDGGFICNSSEPTKDPNDGATTFDQL